MIERMNSGKPPVSQSNIRLVGRLVAAPRESAISWLLSPVFVRLAT